MEDSYKAISQTLETKRDLEEFKANLTKNVSNIKSVMNTNDDIDEILEKYSLEEVNKMSYNRMKEVFVDENGNFIFDEKSFPKQMIIDFIRYLKLSQDTFEKLDQEFVDIDKTIQEFDNEMKTISSEIGSFYKTLTVSIEKVLSDETSSDLVKQNALKLKQGLEDAVTLKPIFDVYEKADPMNTLKEFRDIDRQNQMLKSYVKTCKTYRLQPMLLKLGGIEKYLNLPEETEPNFILYVIAKYIKHLGFQLKKHEQRTFVVQLNYFLAEIILGEKSDSYEADKEQIERLKESLVVLASKFYK